MARGTGPFFVCRATTFGTTRGWVSYDFPRFFDGRRLTESCPRGDTRIVTSCAISYAVVSMPLECESPFSIHRRGLARTGQLPWSWFEEAGVSWSSGTLGTGIQRISVDFTLPYKVFSCVVLWSNWNNEKVCRRNVIELKKYKNLVGLILKWFYTAIFNQVDLVITKIF